MGRSIKKIVKSLRIDGCIQSRDWKKKENKNCAHLTDFSFRKKRTKRNRWKKNNETKCDEQTRDGEPESFQLAYLEISKNLASGVHKQNISNTLIGSKNKSMTW